MGSISQKDYAQDRLPSLPIEGLDRAVVESCIKNLQESFQYDTFIPEICQTSVHDETSIEGFVTIGFNYRLPRRYFLPYELTKESYSNEQMFREIGRRIVLGERDYLLQQIQNNKNIPRSEVDFLPDRILEVVKKMQSNGFMPNVMFTPIKQWLKMMHWAGKTHVKYSDATPRPLLDESLVSDEYELKIVPSLGDMPKEDTILLSNKAINWNVMIYPNHSALFVVFGNSRLYPLRYVELLTGTRASCKIKPEGVSILRFRE